MGELQLTQCAKSSDDNWPILRFKTRPSEWISIENGKDPASFPNDFDKSVPSNPAMATGYGKGVFSRKRKTWLG